MFKMEENDDVERKQKQNHGEQHNGSEESSSQLLKHQNCQNIIQRQNENIQVTHARKAIYAVTQVAYCMSMG